MKEPHRRLSIVAALAGHGAEAILGILMGDGRILKVEGQIREAMPKSIGWLASLPFCFWQRLVKIGVDVSALELRSRALRAMIISLHYFEHDTLQSYHVLPWTLARGDVPTNLRELKDLPEAPLDPTTEKIWNLCQVGYPSGE